MRYNPQIHKRKSIRLKGYDYSQEGLYFITIVTQNREHLFGEIKNRKMILNPFGEIAQEEWIKSIEIRKNISLHEYIIMPNHIHGIIQINYSVAVVEGVLQYAPTAPTDNKLKSPSQTIGAIIRGYKAATTKRIKEIIYNVEGVLQFPVAGVLQYALTDAPTAINIDLKKSIWQRNYWEHIIKADKAYQNISEYIINNPKKWDEDKFHKK